MKEFISIFIVAVIVTTISYCVDAEFREYFINRPAKECIISIGIMCIIATLLIMLLRRIRKWIGI